MAPIKPRKGFTLVEMLVVISIMVILISLISPAIGRAMDVAVRTDCASRLRSLSQSVLAGMQDQNGILPFSTTGGSREGLAWFQLPGVAASKEARDYVCKAVSPDNLALGPNGIVLTAEDYGVHPDRQRDFYGFPCSYTPNEFYFSRNDQWLSRKPVRYAAIRLPSRTIMFSEGDEVIYPFWDGSRTVRFRHNGNINVSFFDGHVRSWSISETAEPAPNPQSLSSRTSEPPYAKLSDDFYYDN